MWASVSQPQPARPRAPRETARRRGKRRSRCLAERGYAFDETAIKRDLVELNRLDLVTLSRADLVEAMNAQDVNASETRYRSATFHFVNLPGVRSW